MAAEPTEATERTAETAWALFWQIFQGDKARRWSLIQGFGLTPLQGMAIGQIEPDDPPTMSALASQMHCDNSSLTGIVDRLEALGYVERIPAPHDRRARCVALTADGRELRERFLEAMRPAPPPLQTLTAKEAAKLHDLLATAVERHEAQAARDAGREA